MCKNSFSQSTNKQQVTTTPQNKFAADTESSGTLIKERVVNIGHPSSLTDLPINLRTQISPAPQHIKASPSEDKNEAGLITVLITLAMIIGIVLLVLIVGIVLVKVIPKFRKPRRTGRPPVIVVDDYIVNIAFIPEGMWRKKLSLIITVSLPSKETHHRDTATAKLYPDHRHTIFWVVDYSVLNADYSIQHRRSATIQTIDMSAQTAICSYRNCRKLNGQFCEQNVILKYSSLIHVRKSGNVNLVISSESGLLRTGSSDVRPKWTWVGCMVRLIFAKGFNERFFVIG